MLLRIADDVPVVMLALAIAREGFELVATADGLVLRLSPRYLQEGECCGHYIPPFLRYVPAENQTSFGAASARLNV